MVEIGQFCTIKLDIDTIYKIIDVRTKKKILLQTKRKLW